jgi:hypothetical protein
MSYYKKFKLISRTFFWRGYLRWAYQKCIDDLARLGRTANFQTGSFTTLLCGVSGEITADEYIYFVLKRNPKAKIVIIDYADEQIGAIRNLVEQKYPHANITIEKADALDLAFIPDHSVQWIETDGFIEYFDKSNLEKLLTEWRRVLSTDGFITTREFAGSGFPGYLADISRLWVGKTYLGVTFYRHTRKQLEESFKNIGLQFVSGPSPFATYRRYTLIKGEKSYHEQA